MRENLSLGFANNKMHWPACTSVQSDQRLCYSLSRKYIVQSHTCSTQNFNILARLCSWTGWFEPILVNPGATHSVPTAFITHSVPTAFIIWWMQWVRNGLPRMVWALLGQKHRRQAFLHLGQFKGRSVLFLNSWFWGQFSIRKSASKS